MPLTIIFMVEENAAIAPVKGIEPSEKKSDPERLRRHVVALSETFHPRDWTHPENLNRCADYIAGEMKAAGADVEMQDFTVTANR